MPVFDGRFAAEVAQNVSDPVKYFIKRNKITWTFPDKSCNDNKNLYQEVLFKKEFGHALYEIVVAYMKNYHASIKQGDNVCIALSARKGSGRLEFKGVETNLRVRDVKKKYMSEYFDKAIYNLKAPSSFYVDSFTTQWCYSIYNDERDLILVYSLR
mgnify:CR=1 FL=1